YLELLEPYWYRSIVQHEKQNIPSLLFLDELSTVQENVQGAMLQLIFDRTIGHGKALPASTLIVSAANYKQNIPFIFNIMAPILNRFCIVNLRYESNRAFLDEFLQDESRRSDDIQTYAGITITDETKTRLREGLKTMWAALFEQSVFDEQNSLDINNQIYNNIYENDTGYVYNFITGRTIYYLYRMTLSFLSKGLSASRHGHIMLNMVFGLVGLGTNSFNETLQKSYLKKLETLWIKLYAALEAKQEGGAEHAPDIEKLNFEGKSVSAAINEWTLYREASIFTDNTDNALESLIRHISGAYNTESEQIERFKQLVPEDSRALFEFTEDMQKIDYLISTLSADTHSSRDSFLKALYKIQDSYAPVRKIAFDKLLNK
ncbi:MAG: ATP-binding protein, partial [Spirochaetaceae bacterium]|nr:ATP-binding protein [Spirochaetaceae bacterium]